MVKKQIAIILMLIPVSCCATFSLNSQNLCEWCRDELKPPKGFSDDTGGGGGVRRGGSSKDYWWNIERWSKKKNNKKQSLKQRNKNISTLPSKCHAGAQRLTTAAKSNTVDNMLLLFLRAKKQNKQRKKTKNDRCISNFYTVYFKVLFFFLW